MKRKNYSGCGLAFLLCAILLLGSGGVTLFAEGMDEEVFLSEIEEPVEETDASQDEDPASEEFILDEAGSDLLMDEADFLEDFQEESALEEETLAEDGLTDGEIEVQPMEELSEEPVEEQPEEEQLIEEEPRLLDDWDPVLGDRMTMLVFIGRHMDRAALEASLDACLVEWYPTR